MSSSALNAQLSTTCVPLSLMTCTSSSASTVLLQFGIAQGLGPGTANLHTSASTARVERSQGNGHTHVIPKAYVYMKGALEP